MKTHTFSRNPETGRPDLSRDSLRRFAAKVPGEGASFTISRELSEAVAEEIIERTRVLCFDTKLQYFHCMQEVLNRDPELRRLAYANVRWQVHGDDRLGALDASVDAAPKA